MPVVIFAAPFFNPLTLRFIETLGQWPDVRLGVISQTPQEDLAPEVRAHIAGHWRVADALNAEQLAQGLEALAEYLGPIAHVFAINEQSQVPLAEARERLGLPGTSSAVARNFRDKARMKALLREAGLPCARYQLATTAREAWAFANEVGWPLIVKPPAGAASQATFRVNTSEELVRALHQLPPASAQPVLLEEFITGAEHSLDTFSVQGRAVWHSWTNYHPNPLEVMHTPWMQWRVVLPREADDPRFAAIQRDGARALEVLGMDSGLSHMEWFERADGTIAISEVGMRPPGAQFTTLMARAHNFDTVAAYVRLLLDGTFDPPTRAYAAGAAYLRGQGRGRVIAVHGTESVLHELGDLITDIKIPQPGQPASATYEGEGYILVRHPETAVVEAALLRIVNLARVELG